MLLIMTDYFGRHGFDCVLYINITKNHRSSHNKDKLIELLGMWSSGQCQSK